MKIQKDQYNKTQIYHLSLHSILLFLDWARDEKTVLLLDSLSLWTKVVQKYAQEFTTDQNEDILTWIEDIFTWICKLCRLFLRLKFFIKNPMDMWIWARKHFCYFFLHPSSFMPFEGFTQVLCYSTAWLDFLRLNIYNMERNRKESFTKFPHENDLLLQIRK